MCKALWKDGWIDGWLDGWMGQADTLELRCKKLLNTQTKEVIQINVSG